MHVPGTLRISMPSGAPQGAAVLNVELVDEDGIVLEAAPPIPLPLKEPITFGRIWAQAQLNTSWTGIPEKKETAPAGGKPAGPGGNSTAMAGGKAAVRT